MLLSRRLRDHLAVALVMLAGCMDPPVPAAAQACGPAGGATAPHVCWAGPEPTGRPHALLLGVPGGQLDRIAAHPDVATFLNDRFEARFLPRDPTSPDDHTLLLDPIGCLLPGGEIRASTPASWIAAVNIALLTSRPGAATAAPAAAGLARPGIVLAPGHPLTQPCSASRP